MENKIQKKKILYVVLGNNCQLNCKFCFNKFVDTFREAKDLDTNTIISTIDDMKPDVINFIGGEPLLNKSYIDTMTEVLCHYYNTPKDIAWCLSSNLYFPFRNNSVLSNKQIKLLRLIQDINSEDVAIGTSYSVDRFAGDDRYWEKFVDNLIYLREIGLKIGITVTLTEDQITKEPPEKMFEKLDKYCDSFNIERCIYPVTDELVKLKWLSFLYKESDEYMKKCFQIIPKEKNYQFNRFHDAVKFRVPVFDNHCSDNVKSLFSTGITDGCPLNSTNNSSDIYYSKVEENKCLLCEFYPYCKGDCECTRSVCAFPKETVRYMKEVISSEYRRYKLL